MVFYIAVSFLFGIWCASLHWKVTAIAAGFFSAGIIFSALRAADSQKGKLPEIFPSPDARKKPFIAIAVSTAVIIAGAWYLNFFASWQARQTALPFGKTIAFTAVVSSAPTDTDKYEIIPVQSKNPPGLTVDIFRTPGSEFAYGDLLQIDGKIEAPTAAGDNPAMFFPKVTFLSADRGPWLATRLMDFKSAVLQTFNAVLPQDEAALLGGITVGGTSGMSSGLKAAMNASGTSYITTMYGFKMAVVVFMLDGALLGFAPRRTIAFLAALIITLFVMMAGGNASAVRAGIMSILVLLARVSGRRFNAKHALALTALGMALVNPRILMDAAFQLSFLSVAGIVYIAPPLKAFIHYKDPGILAWRESAVIAVATLVAIIPVVLADFGSFSLTAFLSNTLIMIAVLPLIFFGFAIALLGSLSYYLSFITAKMAEIFLWYQIGVIKLFAAFVVPLPGILGTPIAAAAYYLALIIFAARHEIAQRMAIE